MKCYNLTHPQNAKMMLIIERGGEEIEKAEKTIAGLHDEMCSKHAGRRVSPRGVRNRVCSLRSVCAGYRTVLLYYIIIVYLTILQCTERHSVRSRSIVSIGSCLHSSRIRVVSVFLLYRAMPCKSYNTSLFQPDETI